jgi:tetratricopeptide (TPR) repeat protein
MTDGVAQYSASFKRLYCDVNLFRTLSAFHPINFGRVLPFQPGERVVDDIGLADTEEAYLAYRSDPVRIEVVDAWLRCGLLEQTDASNLKSVIDFFDADFFDLMGLVYANAGSFRCALRWYRESIADLESRNPNVRTDRESAYASVGYCLYSLGLFEEAISWTKSCIGPGQTADAVCQALLEYEAQPFGGTIKTIERSGQITRYTASAKDPAQASQSSPRLVTAMKAFAPFQEFYIDWIGGESPCLEMFGDGYPFNAEFDGSSLLRHKMNLIFATCGRADDLIKRGYAPEARRLLSEAAMLEPRAEFIWDKIKALP